MTCRCSECSKAVPGGVVTRWAHPCKEDSYKGIWGMGGLCIQNDTRLRKMPCSPLYGCGRIALCLVILTPNDLDPYSLSTLTRSLLDMFFPYLKPVSNVKVKLLHNVPIPQVL